MHRRPLVFAGTRIPLSGVYSFIDAGDPPETVLEAYPDLRMEDVEAALEHRRQASAA